ncbi:YiiX/YebB-like N1pC/P60 family cysteine hydrolase [uncultured Deefgea sp.]|uniref:YiiX/YebB-like N1pC/P60 family cysteine hydrolase n=1 Tax=uncultured Deefgea sp. TaxID=1304914 RepID=UPI0035B61E18
MDKQHTTILTALAQVGKEYDFNFDVVMRQRIVCSELVYVVFPELPWPISKALGRDTISPDNVAQLPPLCSIRSSCTATAWQSKPTLAKP